MQYDPRMDFYRQAIQFLFKQTPAITICFVGCFIMWQQMERQAFDSKSEIARINAEWSKALDEAREDWRLCEEKREALAVKVAAMEVKMQKIIKSK
jgi:hypothetical protein